MTIMLDPVAHPPRAAQEWLRVATRKWMHGQGLPVLVAAVIAMGCAGFTTEEAARLFNPVAATLVSVVLVFIATVSLIAAGVVIVMVEAGWLGTPPHGARACLMQGLHLLRAAGGGRLVWDVVRLIPPMQKGLIFILVLMMSLSAGWIMHGPNRTVVGWSLAPIDVCAIGYGIVVLGSIDYVWVSLLAARHGLSAEAAYHVFWVGLRRNAGALLIMLRTFFLINLAILMGIILMPPAITGVLVAAALAWFVSVSAVIMADIFTGQSNQVWEVGAEQGSRTAQRPPLAHAHEHPSARTASCSSQEHGPPLRKKLLCSGPGATGNRPTAISRRTHPMGSAATVPVPSVDKIATDRVLPPTTIRSRWKCGC